jgi:hypothetical protein
MCAYAVDLATSFGAGIGAVFGVGGSFFVAHVVVWWRDRHV